MRTVLALLAAIMLVIAGATSVAAAGACEPSPPDRTMMSQGADHAHQPGAHPVEDDPAKAPAAPCDQLLACHSGAAVQPPLEASCLAPTLARAAAEHDWLEPPATRSRPPDESLRPPIPVLLFV